MNKILADANAVAANMKATQDEVDQATAAVNKAIADLQEKDDGHDPENPDNPDKPDTPDKPDKPDTPDTPDKPDKPDTPNTPDKPDTPDTPDNPDKPDTPDSPDTPDKPDTPDNPDKPNTPDTPDNPDKPGTPDTPDKPDKPNNPSTSDKPNKPNNPSKPSNPIGPNKPIQPGYVNQLNSADNRVSIIGKFPDDIELIVEDLPSDAKENTISSITNKEVVAKYKFEKIFDIYMLRNGVTYTPKGNFSVKIKLDDDLAAKRYLGIAYIADNGTVTMVPSKVQNGYITFTTNHNSYYAIVSSDGPIVDTATTTPLIGINGFSVILLGMLLALMVKKSDGLIKKE